MKILHKVSLLDTIDSVAQKYKVNVNELIKINDLKNDNLDRVESLIIPKNESDFVVIKNLDKEILVEVKSSNKSSLEKLLKNKVYVSSSSDKNIEEGDKIIFKNNDYKHYVVKPLDTLELVAKHFKVSLDHIIKLNNLKTHKLFIGQRLVV